MFFNSSYMFLSYGMIWFSSMQSDMVFFNDKNKYSPGSLVNLLISHIREPDLLSMIIKEEIHRVLFYPRDDNG